MAPNQKTTQPKKSKTYSFLTCFGIPPKTSSSSTKNKKPKKIDARKKFFKLKLFWPKIKIMAIEKKKFIFDPKTAALKTSHNIMLEATKIHQLTRIDHHVSNIQELKVPSKGIIKQSYPKNQSYCVTCHKEDLDTTPKAVVKQSSTTTKTTKDSLMGISIMVALLIIMSIWGRLCAILCMSAWLYCVPLFRGDRDVTIKPNDTSTKCCTDNLDSELYKKKVVLQGLLQRDHKIGIS